VAVVVPAGEDATAARGSAYVRLQYRRQMEIAVVGVAAAVRLTQDGMTIASARVAITALAPVIHRVAPAEAALAEAPARGPGLADAARAAGQAVAAASRPISDVRGSADYRRAMAAVMTRRAVAAATARARGEQVRVPASDGSGQR
jgi:carbon-monoxide dehydrogenase medium subunit